MSDTRVKISSIVENQLPAYVREEFPLVNELLSQYYISLESQTLPADVLQNIDQYVKLDNITSLVESTNLIDTVNLYDDVITVNSNAGFPDRYGLIKIDNEVITYTGKEQNSVTDTCTIAIGSSIAYLAGISTLYTGRPLIIKSLGASPTVTSVGSTFVILSDIIIDSANTSGYTTTNTYTFEIDRPQFTGCIRGFSGITSYVSIDPVSDLVFSSTESDSHVNGSQVNNLSIVLFKEFLRKVKNQVSPGFENREFDADLNENIFIKQSKDFYSSKGTDSSFKILFNVLYGENVTVIKPRDYLIEPSNAQYRLTRDLVVEPLEGNIEEVVNRTIFQDTSKIAESSRGSVNNVEKILRNGREYYIVSLDKDSLFGDFVIHPKTKIVTSVSIGATHLDVDSTAGFPEDGGNLIVNLLDGTSFSITYENKTLTQFFGCSGIDQIIPDTSEILLDDYAYAYSDIERQNKIKFRIAGVLSDLIVPDGTESFVKDDVVYAKTLGTEVEGLKANNWFFNISTKYKVQRIATVGVNPFSYNVTFYDTEIFRVGDSFTAYSSTGDEILGEVYSLVNERTINVITEGELIISPLVSYQIQRNLSRVNAVGYPELANYTANVQNVYSDLDGNYFVASPSLPSYGDQTITIRDISKTFSADFYGTSVEIGSHGFYTGDAVYYTPGVSADTESGIYFVQKNSSTSISLAKSRQNLFNGKLVTLFGVAGSENKIELLEFVGQKLEPQKLIRKISDPEYTVDEYETAPGMTGILINGVEILNYKSKNSVYYGPLDKIYPLSPGRGYDIINPPILRINDITGYGATAYPAVFGNLERIDVLDSGFDYIDTPIITINGGNGTSAKAECNMISFEHSLSFYSTSTAFPLQVDLTNNTIAFTTYHKFRSAEEIIYETGNDTAVGGLSTNSSYYVSLINAYTVKLHKSFEDASSGINTISLTSYGSGSHSLRSKLKKKKIGGISIKDAGYGYENKKIIVTSSGINTAKNTLYAENHSYITGELIRYISADSSIGGLSTSTSYYVTVVDDNNFKLSVVGNGQTSADFYQKTNQFINLTSTGSGNHVFNYPPIEVSIKGTIGVTTFSGQSLEAKINPVFRGEIRSVFIENKGTAYGSQGIIDDNRQPEFILDSGSGAEVIPVIYDGAIIDAIIRSPGYNYNSPPNLIISGTGIGAILSPIVIDGKLKGINVVYGGYGYGKGSTFIDVVPSGSGCNLESQIRTWKINKVQRNITTNQISDDDGFIDNGTNSDYGLQYSHAYAPRALRKLVLSSRIQNGQYIFVPDLQLSSGIEVPSTSHSPIIGWAYDGNPIYGPYGYDTPEGGVIRSMVSGYEQFIDTERPDTNLYPAGFFIEDFVYTGNGDLDKHNGRYCVTPEYPNGVYAYFSTIFEGAADTSGTFVRYKKPVFPYLIGNSYKSKPIDFNFDYRSNQDLTNINDTGWVRNTTPYGLLKSKTSYDYVINPTKIKQQKTYIQGITKGSVDTVGILTAGFSYQVNDKIVFDPNIPNNVKASARVSRVKGNFVTSVSLASSTTNAEFVLYNSPTNLIGFTSTPHGYSNNDIVNVVINDKEERTGNIKTTTNNLYLTTGVPIPTVTGNVAYFTVTGNLSYPAIRENDVYTINDKEEIKVLEIDQKSSRIRVLRNINNVGGITSYSSSQRLIEKTRKLQIDLGISTTYQYSLNKQIYFNPKETIGIGTTSGVGISSTLQFSSPGVGISSVRIPTRAIYFPNHNLETNTELIYSANGGTPISISTNGSVSYQIPDNSVVYCARLSNDLIGISTTKLGIGSTGSFVGLGSTMSYLLYFISTGVGNTHSFKTNYSNVLKGDIRRSIVTVSTASSHGLSIDDNIDLTCIAGITTNVKIIYNDFNRRVLVNPRDFTGSDVDVTNDIITIPNHQYEMGQKVIHTSTSPASGLINNQIYYAIVIDKNRIKLSNTYYDSVNKIPVSVGIASTSFGTVSAVNPPLKITRNQNIVFDVSDSSLSFVKDTLQYSAFDLNFYSDINFKNPYLKSPSSEVFDIVRQGNIGIDSTAKVTLNIKNDTPDTLYYTLEVINKDITTQLKKDLFNDAESVVNNNKLIFVDSLYSGRHTVTGVTTNSFTYNSSKVTEVESYSYTTSSLSYVTDSPTAYGSIDKILILDGGSGYEVVPSVSQIISNSGYGALLYPKSQTIGKIKTSRISDIGFDYSSDLSIRPSSKFPDIIKISPLTSFKSIGVTTSGRGYSTVPDLIVLDGYTGNLVEDVELSYDIRNKKVNIIDNTKSLYNVSPRIIPINNSNGVGISSVFFNSTSKDVIVTLGSSFSNAIDFPFEIGSKIFIEGISVGVNSTGTGYNSDGYDYTFFIVTNTDPNIGGANPTITYNLTEFLNVGESPGKYDRINSVGRVIPEFQLAKFDSTLVDPADVKYYIGEEIYSENNIGIVNSIDTRTDLLKVTSGGNFYVGDLLTGSSSGTLGYIIDIKKFESNYDVYSSSLVRKGWKKETGTLNNSFQRIHDSDYYQYFSYSLKSPIAYEDWNDPVSTLNHTSGFKKFSDLIIETNNFVGIETNQDNATFVRCDLISYMDLNCVTDFDLATENNLIVNNKFVSNEIRPNSRILLDYQQSVGNRVLTIDDIGPQFNSAERFNKYTVIDNFDLFLSNAYRARKYIAYIRDKRFVNDRELLLISILHNSFEGYVTQYGRTETSYDLGFFDFIIIGGTGNLAFFPRKYAVNDFDVNLLSYDLRDSITGIASTDFGTIANAKSSTIQIAAGVSTANTIISIGTSYRSAKLLVEIAGINPGVVSTTPYYFSEINLVHDGTDVYFTEYGNLSNEPSSASVGVGLGTFNAYITGSNINVELRPNSGLSTTINVNTIAVAIGNTTFTGVGTYTLATSKIDTKYTSIASSTSPVQNTIASYSYDSYSGGYFIVSIEDRTNNRYEMCELVACNDTLEAHINEFGNIQSYAGLGTFGIGFSTSLINVYFTPNQNIAADVRVYQNALGNYDDQYPTDITFTNASITAKTGNYVGTKRDIKRAFNLTHRGNDIFQRSFNSESSTIVDLTKNQIRLPNHFFVTGEEVSYVQRGKGNTAPIGIGTTVIAGIGTTDKLPSTVYIVKVDELNVKVAASATNALKSIPDTLDLTSVGIGTSHIFISRNQNARILVAIDNVIQSPVVGTALTSSLAERIIPTDNVIKVISGISSYISGDLIRIDNEIMLVESLGYGATNAILVQRPWMGTVLSTHEQNSVVTKLSGDYNITENTLNFIDAPYGLTPISSTTNPTPERDWTGISTRSSFNGRSFMRSGFANGTKDPYALNYIFDNLSDQFNGFTTSFILKNQKADIAGIQTSNAIILLKDVFQGPNRIGGGTVDVISNYALQENAGITSIIFNATASPTTYDINNSNIPVGGVIVSVGSSSIGWNDYQAPMGAGATAVVSAAGTISEIRINNAGGGYRTGIQTAVRVGIRTNTEAGKIVYVGLASIFGGRVLGVAITNPGFGYTSSNPPQVVIDKPLPYANIPLVYSNSSPGGSSAGVGTGAKIDLYINQEGEAKDFELRNLGYGYKPGEILTVGLDTSGVYGIPKEYLGRFADAGNLLAKNRAFIQEEVVSYVEFNYPGISTSPTYNRVKCKRDVGYIIDAISFDLAFGGNSESINAGLAYWNAGTSYVTNEKAETIFAYDYVKFIGQYIINNQSPPTLYQYPTVENQVFDYTLIQDYENNNANYFHRRKDARNLIVGNRQEIIDRSLAAVAVGYTNFYFPGELQTNARSRYYDAHRLIQLNKQEIIDRSLASIAIGYTAFYFPGDLQTNARSRYFDAYRLIQNNRDEIVGSAWTAVSTAYPGVTTTASKCQRDIGYFVDAVSTDVFTGGNNYAREFTLQYFSGGSLIPNGVLGVTTQSIFAFHSARDYMKLAVTNQLTYKNLGISSGPATYGGTPKVGVASTAACYDVQTNINNLVGIVTTVLGAASTTSLPSKNVGYFNVTVGVGSTVGFGSTSSPGGLKCARDLKFFVDAVSTDVFTGGNNYSRQFVLKYFNNGSPISSGLVGEEAQSVYAFRSAGGYMKNALTNQLYVKNLGISSGPATYNGGGGSIGIGSTASCADVQSNVDNLVGIVTTYIGAGSTVGLPTTNYGYFKVDSATNVNAFVGIGSTNVVGGRKCARDLGYIVDAIAQDVSYGSNQHIIYATKKYFNGAGIAITNGLLGEENQSITAFHAARDYSKLAITNQLYYQDYTIIADSVTGINSSLNSCSNIRTNIDTLVGILTVAIGNSSLSAVPSTDNFGTTDCSNVRSALASYVGIITTIIGIGTSATPRVSNPLSNPVSLPTTLGAASSTSPFPELQIEVIRVSNTKFAGWSIGDLEVFDTLDELFDGTTKKFALYLGGVRQDIRTKKGSPLDIEANLLVFINDILQVPGQAYTFSGGSVISFTEAPRVGDNSKILFYKGTGTLDVRLVDILETIKAGDQVQLVSDQFYESEDERTVSFINSSDSLQTVNYRGLGISNDDTFERSLTWCRQTEDIIIDGAEVTKDRILYEPLINPTTNIIRSVGVGSTYVFVDSVQPFFNTNNENTTTAYRSKITITSQDYSRKATAEAVVGAGGTIASITMIDGGAGYLSTPEVSIATPVGLGTSTRAYATAVLSGDTVGSIIVTTEGSGYISTIPPIVSIETPKAIREEISNVTYLGDFGNIIGVSSALSTVSFGSSVSISTIAANSTGLYINPDGDRMYIADSIADSVYSFTLSTPYDLSTVSYGSSVSTASYEISPAGIFFKPDGTQMFVTGSAGDDITRLTLLTPWDITTGIGTTVVVTAANITGIVGTSETVPQDLYINSDGTKVFIIGSTLDRVYQFTLTTGWDFSTLVTAPSTSGTGSTSFSIATEETGPLGLHFNDLGTKMFICGNTAVVNSSLGIVAGEDRVYSYTLSTPWDIRTATYDSQSFKIVQDTSPQSIVFNQSGNAMFILGSTNDRVYQYDLSSNYSLNGKQINFNFHIPTNSAIREILYAGAGATSISGIQTGYYFTVKNSNVGSGVRSYDRSNNLISIGSSYLDNIYEACNVSIATTNVVGLGSTYIARVTVNVDDYSNLSGLALTTFYGEFSWGRIGIAERPLPESFNAYTSYGIDGISTSAVIKRSNPLRYIGYTTTV
jgi:hypothetical protein